MTTRTSTGKAPVRRTTYSRFMDVSRRGTNVLQTSDSSGAESEERNKGPPDTTPITSRRRLLVSDVLATIKPRKVTSAVAKTLPDWTESSKKTITAKQPTPPSDKLPRTGERGEMFTPPCGVSRPVPAKLGSANGPPLRNNSASKTSTAAGGVCLPISGTPSISKPWQQKTSKQPPSVKRQLISSALCEPSNKVKYQLAPGCSGSADKSSEQALDESEEEREETLLDKSPGQSNLQVYRELRNTNLLLGKLINEMRHTERRVRALEERASTPISSSSSSGGNGELRKKNNVPLQVRVNATTCVGSNRAVHL